MRRFVPLSLVASALFMCVGAGSGQAAVLSGAGGTLAASAHASTIVGQVHWRRHHHRHHRHHCWWRHHHHHCRHWGW